MAEMEQVEVCLLTVNVFSLPERSPQGSLFRTPLLLSAS